MIPKNDLKQLFLENWKPKLFCLLGAVFVWLAVDRLLVRGSETEWNIDDIRIVLPE